VLADGNRFRVSPQAYFYSGPFGLIAEYADSRQDVSLYKADTNWVYSVDKSARLKSSAWQLAGSWLLTGEDASFRGVKPFNPFKPGAEGGWGAVELVARIQENKLDDAYSNFADLQRGYALGARTWGVGLNWYLNQSSKFAFNYESTDFTGVKAATDPYPSNTYFPDNGLATNAFRGNTERFIVARYQLSF
jgi:phosphate-selective porin OprO/OprP